MRIEIKGAQEMQRRLQELTRRYPQATGEALREEGERILAESRDEAPKRTGRLRESAYIAGPERSAAEPSVRIGYTAPYALPVHEATEVRHRVGSAKFLESPLKRATFGYLDRIAAGIHRRVGG